MAALFLTPSMPRLLVALDRDRSCSPPSWLAAADQSPVLGRLPPKVIFQGIKTVWWTLTGEPVVARELTSLAVVRMPADVLWLLL